MININDKDSRIWLSFEMRGYCRNIFWRMLALSQTDDYFYTSPDPLLQNNHPANSHESLLSSTAIFFIINDWIIKQILLLNYLSILKYFFYKRPRSFAQGLVWTSPRQLWQRGFFICWNRSVNSLHIIQKPVYLPGLSCSWSVDNCL